MNTQDTKQDVFKSELRFRALLNDDQIGSVIEAIEAEAVTQEHVQELLDSTTLDKQDKCNTLIKHVVVPFNMDRLNNNVKQKLENSEVQYVVVAGDEETPPFVYTVGGLDKVGVEYLYVGPFDTHDIATLLRRLLEDKVKGTSSITTLRYRILEVPLYKLVGDYLKMVALHYPDNRLHAPVYVIELGDDNNLLPGEEGYDTTLHQFSDVSDLEYTVVS